MLPEVATLATLGGTPTVPDMADRRRSVAGGPPGGRARRSSAIVTGMDPSMMGMGMGIGGSGDCDPTADLQTFNLFNRLLNESLEKSYSMGADAFFMFWSCLKDERLAIQFLTHLIKNFVDIDEQIQKKSTKKTPEPMQEIVSQFGGQLAQALITARSAMLSSIVFVALNFDIKASSASADDEPLFEAIQAWKARGDVKMSTSKAEKGMRTYITTLCTFVEDRASYSSEIDVMEALEIIVQAYCCPGLAVPFIMPPDISNYNVGPCFHWQFIFELCHQDEGKMKQVFESVIDMLRVHNTEARLLCLLHLLHELLRSFPAVENDQVRRVIPILETFYFWPCPYGPIAQQISFIAERELSSRGAALRQRFICESPQIAVAISTGCDQPHTYTIPIIHDTAGTTNTEYFKWVTSEELVQGRRPTALESMIKVIVDTLKYGGYPLTEDTAAAMYFESQLADAIELYKSVRELDIIAQQQTEHEARSTLVRLGDLRDRVEKIYGGGSPSGSGLRSVTEDGRDSPTSEGSNTPGSRPRRLRLSTLGRMGSGQGRRESTRRTSVAPNVAKPMRRRGSAMAMPMMMQPEPEQQPQKVPMQQRPMPSLRFEHFDIDCSQTQRNDCTYPSPSTEAAGEALRQILGTATSLSPARAGGLDAGDQPGAQYVTSEQQLKLGVAGGDRALHAYISAMYDLTCSTAEADQECQDRLNDMKSRMSVYLLPSNQDPADNTLAEFIGRSDGWFARHVLVPLSAQIPFSPQLNETNVNPITVPGFKNKSSTISPMSAVRALTEVRHRAGCAQSLSPAMRATSAIISVSHLCAL